MTPRPSNMLRDTGSPQAVRVKIKVILIPLIWTFFLYAGVIAAFFYRDIQVPPYWKPAISVGCYIPIQLMCYIIYFNWKGLKIKYG